VLSTGDIQVYVFDASGWALDKQYLRGRPHQEVWSTFLFPQESPPKKDLTLWQCALYLLAPRGQPEHQLGQFITKGHKIWVWHVNLEISQLYLQQGATMDVYAPPSGTGQT
jgi:hypothetical protein